MNRLVEIETEIRRQIEQHLMHNHIYSIEEKVIASKELGTIITSELSDRGLIGLPSDLPRTSVRVDLVASLGAKLGCRKGDDADDVLSEAIK